MWGLTLLDRYGSGGGGGCWLGMWLLYTCKWPSHHCAIKAQRKAKVLTGLAGVRGQLPGESPNDSSCILLGPPGDWNCCCGGANSCLDRLGVPGGSSLEAADAFDKVDCWDASSRGVPSGPVVITEVAPLLSSAGGATVGADTTIGGGPIGCCCCCCCCCGGPMPP